MKTRTTKKAILGSYENILKVGYCNIQYLLKCEDPIAYTCGADGWHADIYHYDLNTAIVTGYQPFGHAVPYDLCRKYDNAAAKVFETERDYETQREKCRELLDEFVKEALA